MKTYIRAFPYETEQEMMIAKSEVNKMISEGWEILAKGFENGKWYLTFVKDMDDLEKMIMLLPKHNDKKITEEVKEMVDNLADNELLEKGIIKMAIEPKKEEEE